jgi:hypothetical protein
MKFSLTHTHSQLKSNSVPIDTAKHVAPLRQYQRAYSPGHFKVWNVIVGLDVVVVVVVVTGEGVVRGLGTVRLVQASVLEKNKKTTELLNLTFLYFFFFLDII